MRFAQIGWANKAMGALQAPTPAPHARWTCLAGGTATCHVVPVLWVTSFVRPLW